MEFEDQTEKLEQKRKEVLEEIEFVESTLLDYNLTLETFELLSLDELEDLLGKIFPKPTVLRREYCLPIHTSSDQILFVNNNFGQEIKLIVRGGGEYTMWYYGQTHDGQFYEKTITGFDRHEKIYYLDKPLDPVKVCSNK